MPDSALTAARNFLASWNPGDEIADGFTYEHLADVIRLAEIGAGIVMVERVEMRAGTGMVGGD